MPVFSTSGIRKVKRSDGSGDNFCALTWIEVREHPFDGALLLVRLLGDSQLEARIRALDTN